MPGLCLGCAWAVPGCAWDESGRAWALLGLCLGFWHVGAISMLAISFELKAVSFEFRAGGCELVAVSWGL